MIKIAFENENSGIKQKFIEIRKLSIKDPDIRRRAFEIDYQCIMRIELPSTEAKVIEDAGGWTKYDMR